MKKKNTWHTPTSSDRTSTGARASTVEWTQPFSRLAMTRGFLFIYFLFCFVGDNNNNVTCSEIFWVRVSSSGKTLDRMNRSENAGKTKTQLEMSKKKCFVRWLTAVDRIGRALKWPKRLRFSVILYRERKLPIAGFHPLITTAQQSVQVLHMRRWRQYYTRPRSALFFFLRLIISAVPIDTIPKKKFRGLPWG